MPGQYNPEIAKDTVSKYSKFSTSSPEAGAIATVDGEGGSGNAHERLLRGAEHLVNNARQALEINNLNSPYVKQVEAIRDLAMTSTYQSNDQTLQRRQRLVLGERIGLEEERIEAIIEVLKRGTH